uniref:CRAL-TRIO domain-containing protein n=1 Tax=Pavo cristatus TaxID=9049 RepID=A0A8C9F2D7_PAVCR
RGGGRALSPGGVGLLFAVSRPGRILRSCCGGSDGGREAGAEERAEAGRRPVAAVSLPTGEGSEPSAGGEELRGGWGRPSQPGRSGRDPTPPRVRPARPGTRSAAARFAETGLWSFTFNPEQKVLCSSTNGGKDRRSGLILTIPLCLEQTSMDELSVTLDYLLSIPSEKCKARGFTVIVDGRKSQWNVVKTVVLMLQVNLFYTLIVDRFVYRCEPNSCITFGALISSLRDRQAVYGLLISRNLFFSEETI